MLNDRAFCPLPIHTKKKKKNMRKSVKYHIQAHRYYIGIMYTGYLSTIRSYIFIIVRY